MEVLAFIIIPWVICGAIASQIATNKGRSGCGWLVLGIIFGPFSWLAVAMTSPVRDPDEGRRPCPRCAEMIKFEALVCKHCGAEFTLHQNQRSALAPRELDVHPYDRRKVWIGGAVVLGLAILLTQFPFSSAPTGVGSNEKAIEQVKARLVDPFSAQFFDVRQCPEATEIWTGLFESKDSSGDKTRRQRFYIAISGPTFADSSMFSVLRDRCWGTNWSKQPARANDEFDGKAIKP